jgi:hypothetical protein
VFQVFHFSSSSVQVVFPRGIAVSASSSSSARKASNAGDRDCGSDRVPPHAEVVRFHRRHSGLPYTADRPDGLFRGCRVSEHDRLETALGPW